MTTSLRSSRCFHHLGFITCILLLGLGVASQLRSAVIDQDQLVRQLVTAFLAQPDTSAEALQTFLSAEGLAGSALAKRVTELVRQVAALRAAGFEIASPPSPATPPPDPKESAKTTAAAYLDGLSTSRRNAVLSVRGVLPATYRTQPAKALEAFVASGPFTDGFFPPTTPSKSAEDVLLRNAGFSISTGFGVADGKQGDALLLTAVARWNWLQRRATAKWNAMIGPDSTDHALIPYYGNYYYWTKSEAAPSGAYSPIYTAPFQTRFFPPWTAFGPFVGTALAGERVTFGDDEERPWLLGLSFGFGFLDEAASFLYVDVGTTVSPSHGFDDSGWFIGASFDGLVLGKLLGLRRGPAENE